MTRLYICLQLTGPRVNAHNNDSAIAQHEFKCSETIYSVTLKARSVCCHKRKTTYRLFQSST